MNPASRRALPWLALAALGAAPAQPGVHGQLAVERAGELWTFVVQLEAEQPTRVQYQLHAAVDGTGNRSQNQQSGAARLEAGQPQQPSRTTLRIRPGDAYCVTLRVLADGALVASDRVASPEPDPAAAQTRAAAPCAE